MNLKILNTKIQEYITHNIDEDVANLILKGISFTSIETKDIIEQIEAKKRCKKKLPTWYSTPNIYYPNKLNIEQTSSEITAKYKSKLIDGHNIIDLTGGFGVDCFYYSKQFKSVTHCEINKKLSETVRHNYKQLNVTNITTVSTNGIDYLKTNNTIYDWIYIDPSRRHDSKGKVFFLEDCLPNIPEHIDLLFKYSKHIIIKTSPLLDLSIGIGELKHVKTIHIVAINNEVKELLWILEANYKSEITIKTANLQNAQPKYFNFLIKNEKQEDALYSKPLTYLYEPNAAILKAGAFNQISRQLGIFKLHKHSHLYTSDTLIDFPGRRFKIKKNIVYSKKNIKRLGIKKANITTRNFPETVQQIRKKLHISDGGLVYLFFTTQMDAQKIVLQTQKV